MDAQLALLRTELSQYEDLVEEAVYVDRDISGTGFDRPGFGRMLEDAYNGRIGCIMVKDLSRLGRNYLETGTYLERLFPALGIRFISVTDGYDSGHTQYDLTVPLKNIINEFYAKDISRKTISANDALRASGAFAGAFPPYGYLRARENRHMLVVCEERAEHIRQIFHAFLHGKSSNEIAAHCNNKGILPPRAFRNRLSVPSPDAEMLYRWTPGQVRHILRNRFYTGDSVYGKTRKRLYKNEPAKRMPEEEWIIVPDTHPAIIPHAVFDQARLMLQRSTRTGKTHDIQELPGKRKPRGGSTKERGYNKRVVGKQSGHEWMDNKLHENE